LPPGKPIIFNIFFIILKNYNIEKVIKVTKIKLQINNISDEKKPGIHLYIPKNFVDYLVNIRSLKLLIAVFLVVFAY